MSNHDECNKAIAELVEIITTFTTFTNSAAAELGFPESTPFATIIAEIKRLKENQRLPDYSLGKYKGFCPHDRPLSDICPECYSSPNKFRE